MHLAKDLATFKILAQSETKAILQRDEEDAEKLAAGIAKAVAKGQASEKREADQFSVCIPADKL